MFVVILAYHYVFFGGMKSTNKINKVAEKRPTKAIDGP